MMTQPNQTEPDTLQHCMNTVQHCYEQLTLTRAVAWKMFVEAGDQHTEKALSKIGARLSDALMELETCKLVFAALGFTPSPVAAAEAGETPDATVNVPQRVRVVKAGLSTYWYSEYIGEVFEVIRKHASGASYLTIDPFDGQMAAIDVDDCEPVPDAETDTPMTRAQLLARLVQYLTGAALLVEAEQDDTGGFDLMRRMISETERAWGEVSE